MARRFIDESFREEKKKKKKEEKRWSSIGGEAKKNSLAIDAMGGRPAPISWPIDVSSM